MKPSAETPKWQYRLFWYLAYTYFQNEHSLNSFVARLKVFLSRLEDRLYKKKWEHIELRNPIFIVGPHRSGTTILHQVLSLHSAIATPRTYSDLLDLAPILGKKYMRYLIRDRTHRITDPIIVGFDTPQEAQGLFSRYFDKEVVTYNTTSQDDIRNYMRKLLYLERKRRFLWKVPYLTIKLPEIITLFPDALFIYLHRDPIACINSKMKFINVWQELAEPPSFFYHNLVGKHQLFEQDGSDYFMEQANRTVNLQYTLPDSLAMARDHLQWIEQALNDLNNLASSNSRCFMDYSTLILEPHASLRQLFKFLKLPEESDAILEKLDEINMTLRIPKQNLNNIPRESLPAIEEICNKHMQCLSAVDWKSWHVIGSIPGT